MAFLQALSQFQTRLFSTDDSVVAWWQFDEGSGIVAGDSIGTNDGTLLNGVNWDPPGFLTNSIRLDGIEDYVSINASGSPGNIFDRTDTVSVTAWVKPQETSVGEQAVISKGNSIGGAATSGYAMSLAASQNDLTSYFYINGTYCYATNSFSGVGDWHFVGGGYDSASGQRACIADGELNTNNLPAGTAIGSNGADSLLFGAENSGGTLQRFLEGLLDEAILYDRGLSPPDLCNSYLAFCMDNNAGVSCDTSCIGD